MVTNPHVQSRVKHYDLLLARELVLIERKHEHNLVIHKKLEQTIRHESRKIPMCSRKQILSEDEIVEPPPPNINPHKRRAQREYSSAKATGANAKPSVLMPKFRRLCSKAHRLPPITTACIAPLGERMDKERLWREGKQAIDKENEAYNERMSVQRDKLMKRMKSDTNVANDHYVSFRDTLEEYEGVQPGFDSFAASAIYSTRAPVAMK